MPADLAAATTHTEEVFFFLKNGPYIGFIYLEMVGNHSCRLQSMVHIKQFNFFLSCHDFSLLLGSTFKIIRGPLVLFKAYKYCTKNNENDSRTGHLLL